MNEHRSADPIRERAGRRRESVLGLACGAALWMASGSAADSQEPPYRLTGPGVDLLTDRPGIPFWPEVPPVLYRVNELLRVFPVEWPSTFRPVGESDAVSIPGNPSGDELWLSGAYDNCSVNDSVVTVGDSLTFSTYSEVPAEGVFHAAEMSPSIQRDFDHVVWEFEIGAAHLRRGFVLELGSSHGNVITTVALNSTSRSVSNGLGATRDFDEFQIFDPSLRTRFFMRAQLSPEEEAIYYSLRRRSYRADGSVVRESVRELDPLPLGVARAALQEPLYVLVHSMPLRNGAAVCSMDNFVILQLRNMRVFTLQGARL